MLIENMEKTSNCAAVNVEEPCYNLWRFDGFHSFWGQQCNMQSN